MKKYFVMAGFGVLMLLATQAYAVDAVVDVPVEVAPTPDVVPEEAPPVTAPDDTATVPPTSSTSHESWWPWSWGWAWGYANNECKKKNSDCKR